MSFYPALRLSETQTTIAKFRNQLSLYNTEMLTSGDENKLNQTEKVMNSLVGEIESYTNKELTRNKELKQYLNTFILVVNRSKEEIRENQRSFAITKVLDELGKKQANNITLFSGTKAGQEMSGRDLILLSTELFTGANSGILKQTQRTLTSDVIANAYAINLLDEAERLSIQKSKINTQMADRSVTGVLSREYYLALEQLMNGLDEVTVNGASPTRIFNLLIVSVFVTILTITSIFINELILAKSKYLNVSKEAKTVIQDIQTLNMAISGKKEEFNCSSTSVNKTWSLFTNLSKNLEIYANAEQNNKKTEKALSTTKTELIELRNNMEKLKNKYAEKDELMVTHKMETDIRNMIEEAQTVAVSELETLQGLDTNIFEITGPLKKIQQAISTIHIQAESLTNNTEQQLEIISDSTNELSGIKNNLEAIKAAIELQMNDFNEAIEKISAGTHELEDVVGERNAESRALSRSRVELIERSISAINRIIEMETA